MRQFALIFLLLCLFIQLLYSQNDTKSSTFAVTASEVQQLLESEVNNLDFILNRTAITRQPLPYGHYLTVRTQGELLSWKVFSHNKHQLYVHNDNQQLNVSVVDERGEPVKEADIYFEKRKMRLPKEGSNFSSRRIKSGLLVTYLPSDTLFQQINGLEEKSIVRRRLSYFSKSDVGRIASQPLRWVHRGALYIKRGFKRGQWRIRHWPFQRLYNRLVQTQHKNLKGYMASNQPIYRIGDTLKLTAYAANTKGRPVNKALQLTIQGKKLYMDSMLMPIENGRYVMDWVLGDSLPMDAFYSIRLTRKEKNHYSYLQHRFKIEDYQLDEYSFKLLTNYKTFKAHEPVEIKVQVSDANGLVVAATTVDGYILSNSLTQIYTDSTLLPDTLWQFREEMGDRRLLSLFPPDSIWPQATTKASLFLRFQGPSGKTQEERTTLTIERPEWVPLLQLKEDSIKAFISGHFDEQNQPGEFISYSGNTLLQTKELSPNTHIKLNPFASHYEWLIGGKKALLYPKKEDDALQFNYAWRNDSLQIVWSNPRRLPLQWSLKTSSGQLKSGESNDELIRLSLSKNQQKRQLWLYYNYPWAGQQQAVAKDIKAINDQLQMKLETPEKIYPGQTENISILVHDAKGKPVKSTAVTAAAFNAQFKQVSPYRLSSIHFKGRRKPFIRQRYTIKPIKTSGTIVLNKSWYEKLALSPQLYYRIRFPASEGLYEYRSLHSKDSLAQQTAQLAPFLTQNGRLLPIHLIYLDNRLVYYYDAWKNTPYSIVAAPGYHQLTLRTTTGEVHIDSVLLKAGQALDLSFDLGQYDTKLLSYKTNPRQWSRQEIKLIEKQTFYMRPMKGVKDKQFLYQNPKHIFRINSISQGTFAWGLFPFSKEVTWLKPGFDSISFPFEPYFSYQLSKKRDRLYQHRPLSSRKSPPLLPNQLPHPVLAQEAIFLEDIEAPKKQWRYSFSRFPNEMANNRGRVQLFTASLALNCQALLIARNGKILYLLPPQQSTLTLPKGLYTLMWVMKDSTVLKKDITVTAYHLFALNVQQKEMTKQKFDDSIHDFLEQHKQLYASQRSGYTYRHIRRTQQNNPYQNNGRLISGIITDNNGEVLIGASIYLHQFNIGTVSDIDGYYELWVPFDAREILVSYTGYAHTVTQLGAGDQLSITMEEDAAALSEVVVTAMGIRSEKKSIGMAVRTDEDIRQLPTRNINALAVTTAGLSSYDDPVNIQIQSDFNATQLPIDSIRDNFKDYAYWQPTLSTDHTGRVTFPVTFPDDITSWRHFALGMDRNGRLGLSQSFTMAYLPIQAQLYTPRFLLEGDRSTVRGLLTNRSGQALEVTTYLQQKNGQKEERHSTLELSAKEVFELESVPKGTDSLEYTYGLQTGEYRDGEVRQIPVFPIGSKRTIGAYRVLNKDSIYPIITDPIYGPVDMRIGGNGLPQLLKEINWLRNYPYGCNEQTASRLMALLAIKSIQHRDTFDVKLEQDIVAMIHRLDKNRQADGSWGWWASSSSSSVWISQHVLKALRKAQNMGYKIPDTTTAERYLLGFLPSMEQQQKLNTLLFFAERDQVLDYGEYLQEYDTLSRPFSWELSYRRIQQLQGIPYRLDSLNKYIQRTLTGAHYWGTSQYWPFRPSRQVVGMTLRAYQLYKDAGLTDSLAAIQQYFMEDDPFHPKGAAKDHWAMNTYEAGNMVAILLPDLLGDDQDLQPLKVVVRQDQQLLTEMNEFPKQLQILPTSKTAIDIEKSGDGPAFVSYHQSYWDVDPPAESNGFTIETAFLEKGKLVNTLKLGQSVQLNVSIQLEAKADYVLLEIPVPAGCSYGHKIFRQNRWETHREYKRDRVTIFLETLPAGEHYFTVNLEPRFKGIYTVNPARVEMMYVPVFNGSTRMKKVTIP